MRIFLIELVASLVASIALWNFGLSQKIWPEHPLAATVLIAGIGAALLHMILRSDAARDAEISKSQH